MKLSYAFLALALLVVVVVSLAEHDHVNRLLVGPINHPVFAHGDPPIHAALELLRVVGAWVVQKIEDRAHDLTVLLRGKSRQFLVGGLFQGQPPHSACLSRSVNDRIASTWPIHSPRDSATCARAIQYAS